VRHTIRPYLAVVFIKVFGPDYLYRFQEVRLDLAALGFVLAATVLVAFLSGILPAFSLSKVNLASALKEEAGRSGTGGVRRQRLQSNLVIGQVGLGCILLVGAGLLVRSFVAAENAPLGFNSEHLLTATIDPTAKKYQDPVRLRNFFAVGLYAVLAYSVSQRRREIGVRIALGAQSSNIIRLIIRQGLRMVAIGLVIGMIAASLIVRFIESILYGVSGGDPIAFTSAVLILSLAASLACLLPALRATRVNPITALRE
jgi:predicted lysophospholipase L1 biosynthesis ABC-type transport system permease subunit